MDKNNNSTNWNLALTMQMLVYPGSGYFLIGKKLRGMIVVIATSYFLFMPLVRFTLTLMQFLRGGPSKSMHAFSLAWAAHKELVMWSLIGILVLWIFGIVDVWRMKRKEDIHGMHT